MCSPSYSQIISFNDLLVHVCDAAHMTTFGKKHRKDWNAQDSARDSMAYLLGAQLRNKRQAADKYKAAVICGLSGVGLAALYFVVSAIIA